jgi:hypothetical protein
MVALIGVAMPGFAQITGGTISGRVIDASDAAIPGALITIQNQATGQTRNVNTNEKGFYNAPNLPPGRYNATSAQPGFGDLVIGLRVPAQ